MVDETTQDRLFEAVLIEGTDDAAEAWVALGPEGVDRLRAELNGERRVPIPEGVHTKTVLDNFAHASRLIASAYPEVFLGAFESSEWDGNAGVVAGLGGIRRADATRRLMRLLRHDDKWIRIQAAVALRDHRHPGLRSALMAALDDPEDLVRYHVEERLAELDGREP